MTSISTYQTNSNATWEQSNRFRQDSRNVKMREVSNRRITMTLSKVARILEVCDQGSAEPWQVAYRKSVGDATALRGYEEIELRDKLRDLKVTTATHADTIREIKRDAAKYREQSRVASDPELKRHHKTMMDHCIVWIDAQEDKFKDVEVIYKQEVDKFESQANDFAVIGSLQAANAARPADPSDVDGIDAAVAKLTVQKTHQAVKDCKPAAEILERTLDEVRESKKLAVAKQTCQALCNRIKSTVRRIELADFLDDKEINETVDRHLSDLDTALQGLRTAAGASADIAPLLPAKLGDSFARLLISRAIADLTGEDNAGLSAKQFLARVADHCAEMSIAQLKSLGNSYTTPFSEFSEAGIAALEDWHRIYVARNELRQGSRFEAVRGDYNAIARKIDNNEMDLAATAPWLRSHLSNIWTKIKDQRGVCAELRNARVAAERR